MKLVPELLRLLERLVVAQERQAVALERIAAEPSPAPMPTRTGRQRARVRPPAPAPDAPPVDEIARRRARQALSKLGLGPTKD